MTVSINQLLPYSEKRYLQEKMDLEARFCHNVPETSNDNVHKIRSLNKNIDQRINKDSVNTNIEEQISQVITNPQNKKKINQNAPLESNKKKPIIKNKQKNPNHIMKHQKILQTLRNITKNIKNQINIQKPFDQKQKVNKMEVEIVNKQPEINYVQNGIRDMDDQRQLIVNIKKEKRQMQKLESQKKLIQQPKLVQTPQKPTQSINKLQQHKQPPQQQNTDNKNNNTPQQKITLYSKYKNTLQSYPIYQQKILTDKKQLRQVTIQRQIDNDIESEDQQIQLGVGYLYYQLVSSCKKNNSLMKMANSLMKSRSKVKQRGNQVKMQCVKQRLVFN